MTAPNWVVRVAWTVGMLGSLGSCASPEPQAFSFGDVRWSDRAPAVDRKLAAAGFRLDADFAEFRSYLDGRALRWPATAAVTFEPSGQVREITVNISGIKFRETDELTSLDQHASCLEVDSALRQRYGSEGSEVTVERMYEDISALQEGQEWPVREVTWVRKPDRLKVSCFLTHYRSAARPTIAARVTYQHERLGASF